jgi:hypothetical protein
MTVAKINGCALETSTPSTQKNRIYSIEFVSDEMLYSNMNGDSMCTPFHIFAHNNFSSLLRYLEDPKWANFPVKELRHWRLAL